MILLKNYSVDESLFAPDLDEGNDYLGGFTMSDSGHYYYKNL